MKLKKVASFTLSELMVVLVISSIVVTIAFFALNAVQRMTQNTQKSFQTQQEVQHLERALWIDINRYKSFYFPNKKQLLFANKRDTIRYQFLENKIAREKDTFSINTTSLSFFIDDKTVIEGEIDAVSLQFEQALLASEIFVYKRKDAAYYINQ